ncbi:MAG TPA: PEGA domain-containing protein [Polyangia bacterium]|jgi:hypothetical protein|nr:PEGA domain-containing protein [Polyangia bacterium]
MLVAVAPRWGRAAGVGSLLLVLSAAPAEGAPAGVGAPSGASAGADDLISQALAYRRAGNDAAALPLLQRAYGRSRTPRAAAQLGFVEQALGVWVAAEVHLFEALTARRDPWVRRNVQLIEESLRMAHDHVGLIRVEVDVAGADVLIDGALVGRSPLRAAVRVATGPRRIEVRAAGFRSHLEMTNVTAGKTSSLIVHLQRAVPLPPPLRARAAPQR